jgi:hypothetical protein
VSQFIWQFIAMINWRRPSQLTCQFTGLVNW